MNASSGFFRCSTGNMDWTKLIGFCLWGLVIILALISLGGCGTFYIVDVENHNEGNGTLIAAADSKGELDGEQNATIPVGDGSVGAAGSLLDRITPNVLKPVKIDNSDNSVVNPEPVKPEPTPIVEEELGVVDEVDNVDDIPEDNPIVEED